MPIDFSFSQEVEDARLMMRAFLHETVKPAFAALQADKDAERADWSALVKSLRQTAKAEGFWLPHMPQDVGGMGLGCDGIGCGLGGSGKDSDGALHY